MMRDHRGTRTECAHERLKQPGAGDRGDFAAPSRNDCTGPSTNIIMHARTVMRSGQSHRSAWPAPYVN